MTKKINLNLIGIDGNAFSLLGAFRYQAKKEGWSKEEIEEVTNKAKDGDYYHLVNTLNEYCEGHEPILIQPNPGEPDFILAEGERGFWVHMAGMVFHIFMPAGTEEIVRVRKFNNAQEVKDDVPPDFDDEATFCKGNMDDLLREILDPDQSKYNR